MGQMTGEPALAAPIVRPGRNCWRVALAHRAAPLVDAEAYFLAARAALENARHSILLLGWDFDPRTNLCPQAHHADPLNELGTLLNALAARRPTLDIRLLIWDMALPISALRLGFPQRSRAWFDSGVRFRVDGEHPAGACHHQKVLVIDDCIAFCGGSDFATDRWDTTEHLDDDQRRKLPSGKPHPPRHDVMLLVDGPAASALGELARSRWERATGECVLRHAPALEDPWPRHVRAELTDVPIALARTEPEWNGRAAVREVEQLHLDSIARAQRLIYLENQYLVAPPIADALAARLTEANGPEIVVVCPAQSPSYFDRLAIDEAQCKVIEQLVAADRHHRFRAYTPVTRAGNPIIVHSKVTVIDDRLLRVGSANLSNRSLGFDTECDLALDAALVAPEARHRAKLGIERFRNGLLAHHLGVEPSRVRAAMGQGQITTALDELANRGLRDVRHPLRAGRKTVRSLIAEYHIGDPQGAHDAWRPWLRRNGGALPPRSEEDGPQPA